MELEVIEREVPRDSQVQSEVFVADTIPTREVSLPLQTMGTQAVSATGEQTPFNFYQNNAEQWFGGRQLLLRG